MGASAREIEREIKETRERLDVNLNELEGRATSNAVKYGRVAAVVLAAAGVATAGFVIWRKTRRPSVKDRLDSLSIDSLRDLAEELSSRLREQLPSVTVRVNEEQPREPGTVESILRKVAPSLIGTASTAVLERVARADDTERTMSAPPQAD